MNMRKISDFEDFLIPYAPDAPAVTLQHVARQSVNRFLRATRLATDEFYFDGQEKVSDYLLDIPHCRQLVQVERMWFGPKNCSKGVIDHTWMPLTPRANRSFSGWWMDEHSQDKPVVFVAPAPSCDQNFAIEYSWTIGRDDCDVPAFVYEEWMDAIVAGAMTELLMIPNQEWTDKGAAVYYQEVYANHIQSAKNRKWTGRSRAPVPMMGRRFL